jgi:filamentous hemagglutinin family protein
MTRRLSHGPQRMVLATVLLYMAGGVLSISHAQIVSNIVADRTLPTPTVVALPTPVPGGNRFDISGGTVIGGVNQFHSFDRFSVGTNDTANFSVANSIKNIISRVTGGVGSQIDGTLTSTISGTSTISSADLYLLNPAGILFGKNAQLNIGGSFHASTGDYVKLGTEDIFYADSTKASALTSASPSAFGFLTSNLAAIDVQTGTFTGTFPRRLQVPVGQTLSLVGGPVNVGAPSGQLPAGFVFAPGGVVNIASVASPGEATSVALPGARPFSSGINVDGFAKLGEIHLTGGAVVDGKNINIRGGRLEIRDATLFPGVSFQVGLPGAPAPNGGQVNINVTDDVTITSISPQVARPGIQTFAGSGSNALVVPVQGDVPGINIKAGSFSISGPLALIQSSRFGPANPPTVAITANNIEVRNGASIGMTNSFGGGPFPTDGGTLTINGNNMTISSDGSSLTGISATSTFHPAYGAAGPNNGPPRPTAFSPFFQFADSASVTINLTGNLTVQGNTQITTDSFAFGRSGAININAANMLFVGAGPTPPPGVIAAIAAQSERANDSGSVTLRATGNIDIQNGFRVSANTFGSGNGGTIDVTAGGPITLTGANSRILSGTLQLTDAELNSFAQRFAAFFGVFPATSFTYASLRTRLGVAPAVGDFMQVLKKLHETTNSVSNPLVAVTDITPGDAGRISITTPLLTLNADTRIETSTGWDGNAGAVLANVGSLFLKDGAAIRSTSGIQGLSGAGNAGSVTITATGPATISVSGRSPTTGAGSSISTSTIGAGAAGNISLIASDVTVGGGAQVSSSTSGAGAGGTVGLTAGELVSISGEGSGLFSTTSGTGNAGQINVSTPTLTMGDGGTISVATSGVGNAGNTALNVGNFTQSGGSRVDSSTSGGGSGGGITVTAANSASISGPGTGLFSTASSTGAGGDINLQAPQVQILDGATISANSTGTATATAGNVNIVTSNLNMQTGSITTESTLADGGNISITTTGSMVHLTDSEITTSVQSGSGSGGNITIDSDLVILDDSRILANAFGGPGGNINVTADVFLVNSGGTLPTSLTGIVDASSVLSTPGTINIQATFTDVTGEVAQLPETPLRATELLRAACAARFAGGKASSLVLGGRDGVPIQPGGLLPSPLYLANEAGTPSTGARISANDLPVRFSLLGSAKDGLSNRYSLLPNAKCAF